MLTSDWSTRNNTDLLLVISYTLLPRKQVLKAQGLRHTDKQTHKLIYRWSNIWTSRAAVAGKDYQKFTNCRQLVTCWGCSRSTMLVDPARRREVEQ